MKKTIYVISLIIISLFLSFSYVYANNDGKDAVNAVRNTVGGAENVVEDTAKGTAGAVRSGFNTIGEGTENVMNDAKNMGNDMGNNAQDETNKAKTDSNYNATRTATENGANNATTGMSKDVWTWIIVAIISIVIIALIWYYASRNNS